MHWKITSIAALPRFDSAEARIYVVLLDDQAGALKKTSLDVATALMRACCGHADLTLHKNALGKPIASDARYHVSISHAGACLMVGVATVDLGVDIDYLRYPDKWRDTGDWIRHADAAPDETGNERRFLECWTAKEAMLKLSGLGLDFGLHNLALPPLSQDKFARASVAQTECWLKILPDWHAMQACLASAQPCAVRTFRIPTAALPG